MTITHICDGCGQRVDAEHVRQRIARLERATSYRPIHIATLLLWHAPPPRLEDYFYSADGQRSAEWEKFFETTLERCGLAAQGRPAAELLTDFQRQGFFLADCVECPLPADAAAADRALRDSIPTVIKRIQLSYKPKLIVCIGEARKIVSALRASDYVATLLKNE